MSPLRWALVAGGFVGTLVILRPGGDAFSWAILLPLGLVVSNAWFQVLTSRLAHTEKPADHALLHRLGRHPARDDRAALRLDRPCPHGIGGRCCA